MKDKLRHNLSKVLFIASLLFITFLLLRRVVYIYPVGSLWRSFEFFLAGFALFAIFAAYLISYYEYHGIGSQEGIYRYSLDENAVALTFDDGPSPLYTPQILDILDEKGVKATFFVVGKHVEKYPHIAKEIVRRGHDIGNHTYSHRELVPASRATILKEVRKGKEAIEKVTGISTELFRPPRGIISQAVRKLLVEEGYRIVMWTASSTDWRSISAKNILRRIKLFIKGGGIILFHDSGAIVGSEGGTRKHTVEALPMVIDYLQEKGYEIVPISEMMRRDELRRTEEEERLEEA